MCFRYALDGSISNSGKYIYFIKIIPIYMIHPFMYFNTLDISFKWKNLYLKLIEPKLVLNTERQINGFFKYTHSIIIICLTWKLSYVPSTVDYVDGCSLHKTIWTGGQDRALHLIAILDRIPITVAILEICTSNVRYSKFIVTL